MQQLRACGVSKTIRISAAGFPSRKTYGDFFLRYRCLCKFKEIRRDDLTETRRRILSKTVAFSIDNAIVTSARDRSRRKCFRYIKDENKFKFGKMKDLFPAGPVAYLEKLLAERQRDACIVIEKIAHGLICRIRYRKIQRHGRGYIVRQKAQAVKGTS